MGWSRFFRRKQWDRERTRELDHYLDVETEENIARGMAAAEARRAAHRRLGNPTLIREEIYRMNSIVLLETVWHDLRFALRVLAKSPAFASTVVLSLALGIGANTAIFSLIDAALLKLLPVRQPERLVQFRGIDYWFPYPAFQQFRDHNRVFSGVFAFASIGNVDFEVNGHGEIASGQVVSGDYFSVLGLNAILGRAITPEDDKVAGAGPVAVISYSYWQRRFARDPGVIGKRIVLNNSPFTIIGVTPPEFFGLEPGKRIDVSVPITMIAQARPGYAGVGTPYYVLSSRFRNWLRIMARLKPGMTLEGATSGVEPMFRQAMRDEAEGWPLDSQVIRRARLELSSAGQGLAALRRQFSKPLFILMAAAGLLLLITCANVANLLLARASVRQREIAVRLSIGAGRFRLARQLITESALLAIAGGIAGFVLAFWASRSLLALISHSAHPVSLSVRPDSAVLGFTLLISLLTVVLFGIAPAWRGVRVDLSSAAIGAIRTTGRVGVRSRLAKGLVISQVALSLVLMICAGLLAQSLENLKSFNPGFNKENLLLLSLNPVMTGYKNADADALYQTLLDRLGRLPGVRAVSFSMIAPLSGNFNRTALKVEGYRPPSGEELTPAELNIIGPQYFRTLETPILLGRDLTSADRAGAPKVAIINQTAAHEYFGGADPIGRRIGTPEWVGDPSWLQIVGVVKDSKQTDLRMRPTAIAYVPLYQSGVPSGVTFEIRTAISPAAKINEILHVIRQADGRLPVFDVRTLSDQMDDSLIEERTVASLASLFGMLAAVLACFGLYGLMTYAVNRRTNEIGIRMALGAQPAQISGMILRETLLLIAMGLAIGLPVSFLAARLIRSELYGLEPGDPSTILAAVIGLAAVAMFAAYVPARRASRVEPLRALRYE
jgi:predicted permease